MSGKPNGEYEFHEAANIFPLDDEHIDELAADIKEHGLTVSIQVLDGKILDGRRRYMACKIAGVKPRIEEVKTDDPVAYVLSLNLHRRHLTVSQASMCAGRADKLKEKLAEEAKERKRESGKQARAKQLGGVVPNCAPPQDAGKTREKLAETFGVSHGSVGRAVRVLKDAVPEVIKAVDDGKLTVAKANSIAEHDPGMQKELLDVALDKKQARSPTAKGQNEKAGGGKGGRDLPAGEVQGVGVIRANEALNCLKRIPKNDRLRKRGFQIVTDWIRHNQ